MAAKQRRHKRLGSSDIICFVIIGSLLASVVSIFVLNGQIWGVTKRLALTEATETAREIESIIQARRFVVDQSTLKVGLRKIFKHGGLHKPGKSIRNYFPDLIAAFFKGFLMIAIQSDQYVGGRIPKDQLSFDVMLCQLETVPLHELYGCGYDSGLNNLRNCLCSFFQ